MKKSCLSVARVCPLLALSLNNSQPEDTWGNHSLLSSPRTPLVMFFDQMFAPQSAVFWSRTSWLKALQVMLLACWCVPSTDTNSSPV